jgi:hypothetical protein
MTTAKKVGLFQFYYFYGPIFVKVVHELLHGDFEQGTALQIH